MFGKLKLKGSMSCAETSDTIAWQSDLEFWRGSSCTVEVASAEAFGGLDDVSVLFVAEPTADFSEDDMLFASEGGVGWRAPTSAAISAACNLAINSLIDGSWDADGVSE